MHDVRRFGRHATMLLAFAAATSSDASAQPIPARTVVPAASGAMSGGITVSARATVRRPADLARFSINVANRAQPANGMAGAETLVAALKNAGVADAALATPGSGFISAQQFATVTGSIRKPTVNGLRTLVTATAATVPESVTIQNVNVALYLDSCDAAEAAAIAAAQTQARRRADAIATAAGVSLGRVIAVTALPPGSPPCPTQPDAIFAPFNTGPADLNAATSSLDVSVSVQETITYQIR